MSETRDEMTLERACEILNERRYRGSSDWGIADIPEGYEEHERLVEYVVNLVMTNIMLASYEAIATAEKLERNSTPAPAAPPPVAAEGDGAKPRSRGPSREWLERAGDIEDQCRSVSVGGLAVDTGMYGVAASLAQEAKDRAAAEARPQASTLRSQVMALADLKDGWHDGEGTAYEPTQLAAVAGLLERLAGIATGQVYPVPSGLSEPSGLVRVEWGDRPRDDSLEIDPVTLAARIHLYDLDSGETLIGEIMPESLAEARPRVGEATRKVLGLLEAKVDAKEMYLVDGPRVLPLPVDLIRAALDECEVPR